MKKFSIYLGVIILLFVALFTIDQLSDRQRNAALADDAKRLYNTSPSNLKASTKGQLQDENYQHIILPDTLKQKLNDKESMFVYYFSPECPFCVETTPKLMKIAQTAGVDINQYNLLEFEQGWRDHNIQQTPTLVYYKDGAEVDRIVGGIVLGGAITEDMYLQFLETYK